MPEVGDRSGAGAAPLVRVCDSAQLAEGGRGVRFRVATRSTRDSARLTAFVVRYSGQVHGYLNQCAHVPTELDWQEGEFFDQSGLYLICATHGAAYWPDSGHCAGGPCQGGRLRPITVVEQDGVVYWRPDEYIKPPID
jgi:nitrite reductase/ring-hydroxylating ferredoxin subunit